MAKLTGYELSRQWFDFSFENPEKVKPIHTAIYFFAAEHSNRLGGKDKFGLPSMMTMEAIGVRSHNTFIKALNDLIDWGFIIMHQKSVNQYSANIIALSKNNKALDKALDKALIKHGTKQEESTIQSTVHIVKQTNNKQINNKQVREKVLSDVIWIDSIGMNKKIPKAKCLEYLNVFLNDLELKDDLDKGEKEVKKHFVNWLNIQVEKDKPKKEKVNGFIFGIDSGGNL